MTFKTALTACFCLIALCVMTIGAQTTAVPDPVSGSWGDSTSAGFDLKFDGKHVVSGTVRVVVGGSMSRPEIKSGTFDPKTGALKLEGDSQAPNGTTAHFVIEGTIEKDSATGTYNIGGNKGDFNFTRVNTNGQTTPDRWIGTWTLNVENSPRNNGNRPQPRTLKVEPIPEGLKLTLNAGTANQSVVSAKYSQPDVVINPASPKDTVTIKRVDDFTFEAVTKSDGQITATHRMVVSRDGKTLTQTQATGTSTIVSVYNRLP